MQTFERETRVDAPLDAVWAFHSRPRSLAVVTPDWLHVRVDAVVGPAGESGHDAFEEGTVVRLSIRPCGVGQRQRWTSRIVERTRTRGSARFVDEMVEGPFPTWEHTHSFFEDGPQTVVHDRVRYETPLGRPGDVLAMGFLEPLFAARHRRTREEFAGT